MNRVSLSFFLLSLAFSSALSNSYQQLSLKYVLPALNNVNLDNLNGNCDPGDLGALRKSILLTRSYLDIFVYSYLMNNNQESGGSQDLFDLLRSDLNKGYTLIGDFDDLRFVNYTSDDRDKSLRKCLNWKDEYLSDTDKYNFNKYLENISDKLYYRNKTDLSKDFWGSVDRVPINNLTGYQNIALLSKGQVDNTINAYAVVIALDDIWKDNRHTEFHDFRKLIRSILFIPNNFPQVYTSNVDKYVKLFGGVYSKFGDLNDVINEYDYYEKKGNVPMANKKKQEVDDDWDSLKSWLNNMNLMKTLQVFYNSTV